MKHFNGLSKADLTTFFAESPTQFNRDTDRETLGIALGAALYTPGSRTDIAEKILSGSYGRGTFSGLATLIMCLEDAVSDAALPEAEQNMIQQLKQLEKGGQGLLEECPILFLRVRSAAQLDYLAEHAGTALSVLAGIVFPKALAENLPGFFAALDRVSERAGRNLYALPLLETKEILYAESRTATLQAIDEVISKEAHRILNVRVGATDFSSLFGLRRPATRHIYDLHVVRDCLTDILNRFGRAEKGLTVSGPVYEYFSGPQVLPFLADSEKVLWEEVQLDLLNGFTGKTCIHPSQIAIVNAGHIITKEAFGDAEQILRESAVHNGVLQSANRNKMNEVKPHLNWARKTVAQARVYGVLNENYQPIDVLNHIREYQFSKQL